MSFAIKLTVTLTRTTMEDTELGGQQIKEGDKIVLHYHTANHDEDVCSDDAMRFDVTRAERMPDLYNQLRSFGVGQHFLYRHAPCAPGTERDV